MKFDFDEELERFEHFKGGNKYMDAIMKYDGLNRILYAKLPPQGSVGLHTHETNSEIIYILQGQATFLFDDTTETLSKGQCHYCPKGHSHSLINESDEDLYFFAVVPEQ